MYSVDGPPTVYEFPSVQCGATADLDLLALSPASPGPIAYGAYDADTLDALMLFHTPQSPAAVYPHHSGAYFPLSIVDKKREQARFRPGRDDASRRAMHRLVQRRFVKRKKAEFEQLRCYARKLELHYRTLLLRAEVDILREERGWLEDKVKAQGAAVEPDNDDAEKEAQSGHVPCEEGGLGAWRSHPQRLFQFDLSRACDANK